MVNAALCVVKELRKSDGEGSVLNRTCVPPPLRPGDQGRRGSRKEEAELEDGEYCQMPSSGHDTAIVIVSPVVRDVFTGPARD